MPFMSLQTCIMLPFPPITSPAAWGAQFCTPTAPADLPRPLPVLLPPFWAVRTRPVLHAQAVEPPWTCTVAQWYSLFCFPFLSYFLTFAFLLWPLMKKLSWHFHDTMNFIPDRNLRETNVPLHSSQILVQPFCFTETFHFPAMLLDSLPCTARVFLLFSNFRNMPGKVKPSLPSFRSSFWRFEASSRIYCRCQRD